MKVIVYSTHCPMCNVLEKKLSSANINYEIIDDMEVMQQKGFKTAPVLEVDGEAMNFKPALEWVKKHMGDK